MCGIAGLIHRGKKSNVGNEMTSMLQALKHRGPDSTGFAVYNDAGKDYQLMWVKVAEGADLAKGHGIEDVIKERIVKIESILKSFNVKIDDTLKPTQYAVRYKLSNLTDSEKIISLIEEIDAVEVLSFGQALELIKDLGDATVVSDMYNLKGFTGSHAIGHTRMATESDVDIRSAHPYWAFPYSDVSVVHNGQITNYWIKRRDMERKGYRFVSNCDSELLAVYTAHHLSTGVSLEDSLRQSIEEIDGVFTYLVATHNQLGMAKDTMAAKPLVLYESDDLIAMASEEVAIRAILPQEIETTDPYDEEVRVWQA